MPTSSPLRTRILGTGRAVPEKVWTNADLEKMVDTSDAWIVERTGIKQRHILEEGRTTSDLAAEAITKACQAADIAPETLDCIIVATVTPDNPMPACAVYVQAKLRAIGCAAFDISAACAGFIYGLSIADGFIRGGQFRRVAVVGVEILSRIVDWTDRNTCVLFGDGAGAAVLGPSDGTTGPDRGILSTHLLADGDQADHLLIPAGGSRLPLTPELVAERQHKVKMNGRQVFAHAVRNIASACEAALAKCNLPAERVDHVVAHQANLRILQGVAERCRLPLDKFFLNIDRYGNTSSASIPIALDELVRQGRVKPNEVLLFCAMGAGFSWGSALIRW